MEEKTLHCFGGGREYCLCRSDDTINEKDQLESARMEMGQVREENQRLKLYLDQIMRDYKTLHMQFLDIVKQGRDKTSTAMIEKVENNNNREIDRESELVLLSLGRARDSKKEPETIDKPSSISSQRKFNIDDAKLFEEEDQRLKLGLECLASKSNTVESTLPDSSPTGSSEEPKGEEPRESWPPGKAMKTMRGSDDEVSQQNNNPVKRARVSVRVRCDTPTMNDGCQWRKYGQKIAKGNPCPRAYYRCTVAPSCPVRKQVQRCVEDMSILITTYEGTHNHPLPMSATAMASTTSAAAQMLLSGPSSSSSSHPDGAGPSTAANLHGQNYYLSPEASRSGTMRSSQQLYFHTSSSSSSSCPTITLDLTSSNPSSSSASAHLFTRFNPSTYSSYFPILSSTSRPFSSTSTLSFNSSDSIPTALPITSWGINSSNGLLGSALGGAYTSKNRDNSSISSSIFNSYSSNPLPPQQNTALPDNIVAATKAITADPNFQSVLAAALKSIIGGENGVGPRNPSGPQ